MGVLLEHAIDEVTDGALVRHLDLFALESARPSASAAARL